MASIRQNDQTLSLPDFCNLGVILRVLLIGLGLSAAAALVRQPDLGGFWQEFFLVAAWTQPMLLLSIVVLCPARRWLDKLGYRAGLAAVMLIELVLAGMLAVAIGHLWSEIETIGVFPYVIFTALAAAVMLFYFDQRSRALSPAITEARLEALQARIRPHFLFNSITAVLSLVREEPRRAERALEDMADLFRVLMSDNRQLVKLLDEVRLCRQYLELEQLRLGARLKIVWHIDKMPEDALVPPLVLQPLLENAVYHGIEPSSATGEVNINIYRFKNQVVMTLRNPYLGEGGSHHAGNKMAMANIRERLALHFDVEASLKTQISGDAYQVTINIPYKTER